MFFKLVPWIAGANRVVVADQAGSGKTLAYLVPLVQALKQEEEAQGGGRLTEPRCPRAIVICPTEELCVQVLYTARALSKVRIPRPESRQPPPFPVHALEQGDLRIDADSPHASYSVSALYHIVLQPIEICCIRSLRMLWPLHAVHGRERCVLPERAAERILSSEQLSHVWQLQYLAGRVVARVAVRPAAAPAPRRVSYAYTRPRAAHHAPTPHGLAPALMQLLL